MLQFVIPAKVPRPDPLSHGNTFFFQFLREWIPTFPDGIPLERGHDNFLHQISARPEELGQSHGRKHSASITQKMRAKFLEAISRICHLILRCAHFVRLLKMIRPFVHPEQVPQRGARRRGNLISFLRWLLERISAGGMRNRR